jgi:hypothetical protein
LGEAFFPLLKTVPESEGNVIAENINAFVIRGSFATVAALK